MLRAKDRSGRLISVDVARCLALVGMAATHIFASFDTEGRLHPSYQVAAGRSAALFAVLAGVGLALASGRSTPPTGLPLAAARAGVLARGLFLLALGLLLGLVESPPLVILAYYGLLFAVASLFLPLHGRALALLAAGAALVTPQVSHLVRQVVPPSPAVEPGGPDLFLQLAVTGTYPVLTWTTYVLAGLAVGRLGLRGWRTPIRHVVLGVVMAVAARLLSSILLNAVGGPSRLTGFDGDTNQALRRGLIGTTPRDDWRWLLVSSPHSGTTLDLVHTVGTSLAVLGAALLVAKLLPRILLLPFAAAGSMTLTLYSVHVLALASGSPLLSDDRLALWLWHVVVALVAATLWRTRLGRGPLEAAAARLDGLARSAVSGEDRPVRSRL